MDGDNLISLSEKQELRFLELVEKEPVMSQRHIASSMNIAIGLANALVKRVARKGYIKIQEIPAKRYGYYLTPEGFGAKSRLVSKYLSDSLSFFRCAKEDYGSIAQAIREGGSNNVVCCGSGEVLEIARMVFNLYGITILAVVDPRHDEGEIQGLERVRDLDCFSPQILATLGALVMTESSRPQMVYDTICDMRDAAVAAKRCSASLRVLAPPFMKVTQSGAGI